MSFCLSCVGLRDGQWSRGHDPAGSRLWSTRWGCLYINSSRPHHRNTNTRWWIPLRLGPSDIIIITRSLGALARLPDANPVGQKHIQQPPATFLYLHLRRFSHRSDQIKQIGSFLVATVSRKSCFLWFWQKKKKKVDLWCGQRPPAAPK